MPDRPGRVVPSVARLPRSLLTGGVAEQVAQGESVLVGVVAPRRAGIGGAAHDVFVHDRPGVAGPGKAGELEPAGPAAVFAGRRIEAGVGDPRGGNRLLQSGLGGREEVGIQVACRTPNRPEAPKNRRKRRSRNPSAWRRCTTGPSSTSSRPACRMGPGGSRRPGSRRGDGAVPTVRGRSGRR